MRIKNIFLKNISVGQTVAKNTFWLVTTEVVDKLLLFFLLVWIARDLGPGEYGVFSFVIAFVTLFSVIADFGLSTFNVRDIARDRGQVKKYSSNILSIKLVLSIITFILISLAIQFMGKTSSTIDLVYLASLYIIIYNFTAFLQSIFRAFERMEFEALSKIIYTISLFGLASYCLLNNLGLSWLILSYVIASVISFLITLLFVSLKFTKIRLGFDISFWKYILSESWPFAMSIIFISVYYYMDSIMLSVMQGDETVGWYNAAYKPIMFIIIIGVMALHSTLPVISKLYIKSIEKLKSFANYFLKIMSIIAIPIAFGGTALAYHIMNLLYGSDYLKGVLAFQILIWTTTIIYISVVYTNLLQGTNRQKKYLWATGCGALVNIILNFILIPYFSLYGAAVATFLAELTVLIFIYIAVNKYIKLKILKNIIKPIAASIIMTIILYLLRDFNIVIDIFVGMLIYIILMVIIKGITKDDINKIWQELISDHKNAR